MSKLVVDVTTISKIRPHGNADKLEIAEIKGWQVCVGIGQFQEGQRVVYFPPDTVLCRFVTDAMNVTNYMPRVDKDRDYQFRGRVKQVRLRSEPSFGLVTLPLSDEWEVGEDVADAYGATKYEPPIRPDAGDAEPAHPLFQRYTDIENMRNYPDIFEEGEEVIVTEKIHGTNCRMGLVPDEDVAEGTYQSKFIAGSHNQQRKKPVDNYESNLYWYPLGCIPSVTELLRHLNESRHFGQAILFGETYGKKVQKSHDYGEMIGLQFRAFDIYADGRYLDYSDKQALFSDFNIPMVPVLYRGPFSLEKVRELSSGPTTIGDATHIREGVVVTPVEERRNPLIGRVILKYVSDEYLLAGDKNTDFKDE